MKLCRDGDSVAGSETGSGVGAETSLKVGSETKHSGSTTLELFRLTVFFLSRKDHRVLSFCVCATVRYCSYYFHSCKFKPLNSDPPLVFSKKNLFLTISLRLGRAVLWNRNRNVLRFWIRYEPDLDPDPA